MGGRRLSNREGQHLAIRTDVKGQSAVAVAVEPHASCSNGAPCHPHQVARGEGESGSCRSLHHSNSLNSIATSADDQVNTHLSASSAGNDTISSSGMSGPSTARTSAMLSDDDRPTISPPTSPSLYAHPNTTVLELISNTASSSALPDNFSFNLSRKGSFVCVYTTSTIWLIKAAQLPRLWARTLQVKRKPVAVDILEDGSLLAVLSRPSQVDLYEIHGEQNRQIKKRRTIMLVHEAHSMALSPDGLILITGNSFGIEVLSISSDAPETSRRTLSGPVGDTLEFSDDGRTLLITSYARKNGGSSLFVLPGLYDGPLDEEGAPVPQSPEAVWTGLVLFPETTRIAKQATLLPDADTGTVNELFAFNADEDTWGVYDIGAQRFTQRKMFLPDQQRWTRSEFLDDAMPAVSVNADLAAVALKMRGTTSLWIYQVPEWDYKPQSQMPDHSPIQPCFCVPILRDSSDANQEVCALRWVKIDDDVQRLVAVGNISKANTEGADPVESSQVSKGVIIVLDFDRTAPADGQAPTPVKMEYDLDPLLPGEMLPEGSIDFEREVELVRTRTMAQRRAQTRAGEGRRASGQTPPPGRSRTLANRDRPPPVPTITRDDEEELTAEEAQAAFEMPYDNTQPRSQITLARAATVAAVSPANRRHLRSLPFRPLEYRRADGLREFPHESDADNWVPPPPAYTARAEESQSVSLSHPNAPPRTTSTSRHGARVNATPGSSIPPVPALPTSVTPTQPSTNHPYNHRPSLASHSSTDLTSSGSQNRPTLLHPSTYPSPMASPPGNRRRSSTTSSQHAPLQDMQPPPPLPHHPGPSAYQATIDLHNAYNLTHPQSQSTSRPNLRTRRAIESQIDLRPPPPLSPVRRGSAPDTSAIASILSRRPKPPSPQPPRAAGRSANRLSMPVSGPSTAKNRRSILPRLLPPSAHSNKPKPNTNTPVEGGRSSSRTGIRSPLSAPPNRATHIDSTQRGQSHRPTQSLVVNSQSYGARMGAHSPNPVGPGQQYQPGPPSHVSPVSNHSVAGQGIQPYPNNMHMRNPGAPPQPLQNTRPGTAMNERTLERDRDVRRKLACVVM